MNIDLDNFRCPICLELSREAVEVECCGKVFCDQCLKGVNGRACPHCRHQNFVSHPSLSVRRALASPITDCPNACGFSANVRELDAHVTKMCPKRQITCPAPDCDFSSAKDVFALHIAAEHGQQVVEHAGRLFDDDDDDDDDLEAFATVVNESGRTARLGANGKYYCGAERPCECLKTGQTNKKEVPSFGRSAEAVSRPAPSAFNFSTAAVIGGPSNLSSSSAPSLVEDASPDTAAPIEPPPSRMCGYLNGCNCVACMRMDIKMRGLAKGWLVNSAGSPCKTSPVTKLFYCGRRRFQEDSDSCRMDAYCGPRQGPQCPACVTVHKHVQSDIYRVCLQ